MERCNFFREKIEAIAKHYFFEMLIYFFWPYNGSNCEIKAMKCFLHNPHALTWGENELTRFLGIETLISKICACAALNYIKLYINILFFFTAL